MTDEQVVFVADHTPPLKDGRYKLELSHALESAATSKTFKNSYEFQVAGERFSIDPAEVHKLFPPDKSQGHFDNVLPHVVVTRRTLPWEREADSSHPDWSWLAILVFARGSGPVPTTGTLADLYPSTTEEGNGTLPDGTWSYGSLTEAGDPFLEYGETSTDPCVYLDITPDDFAAFGPSLADLQWNAHARQTTDPATSTTTDYATVVANRVPLPGSTSTAYLVSLEGMGPSLPQADGTYASQPSWTSIRLVSLLSWSFVVDPLEASFANILQGLNGGIDSSGSELRDSQVRLPDGYQPPGAGGQTALAAALDSGYSVLGGADGLADSPAWYRGPLLPSSLTVAAGTSWSKSLLPASSSTSLNVTVSATPTVDMSYSASWQIGRLLALADRNFATGQVSWKRDARLALNASLSQSGSLSGGSRAEYAAAMRTAIADASTIQTNLGATLSVAAASDKLLIPQSLVDWLANLALLQNVPVDYLLPDMQMLPPESLKFFNIDARWIAALLDGAWSLERQPAAQWAFDTAYQPWQQIMAGTLQSSTLGDLTAWPKSGAILNSQLVPDYWPGIQFLPTPSANLLRVEQLGPGTLLLLFDEVLTSLEVRQPPESIHFGFDIDENGNLTKPLKYVEISSDFYPTPPPHKAVKTGQADTNASLSTIPQRFSRLVQLDALASAMVTELGIADASDFTSAEFALEMVETVAGATFAIPGGG
ncbi:MAG: hypothetical protein AAF441_18175 [Pseudomonadota bacterium]